MIPRKTYDGKHVIHFRDLATPIVVNFINNVAMSANLDNIDPDGFTGVVEFDWAVVVFCEKISEERFSHLSETASQRTQYSRIEGILRLKQIIEAGRQANVIQDINEEKPMPKFPSKKAKSVEQDQKVEMTSEPEEDDVPLVEPAPSCIQPLAAVPDKGDYDGTVVEVPAPGIR